MNLDRDTPLLLAPDMRDWVPQDDMVHFVIEAVAGVDMSAFGIIKGAMGFRQFMLRGIDKVSGEWELLCLAHNMKRLWNLKLAGA